ncbi:hypothetical protein [Pseudomonas citronellolis]|uniref:hypothetical protein n=1 Tax=Pseudomonas citronellolis TaxID=53408 RepID=UPI0021C1B114|nr:hypothetical protein [Pseudomonas citronellolis]UXJ54880.1 hypothetical protein N5P21_11990 [Pseudomonas citronellolis]
MKDQWVRSIMGATEKRREGSGRAIAGLVGDSGGISVDRVPLRFGAFSLVPDASLVPGTRSAWLIVGKRKRKDGTVAHAVRIRIMGDGRQFYQESLAVDRRQAAGVRAGAPTPATRPASSFYCGPTG